MKLSAKHKKTWKIQPLHVTVLEILEKKGSVTDEELFQALKAFHEGIGRDDLNKTLMRMEIRGLISVSSSTKSKRLVQLIER